jgi:hypothetical protein
MAFEYLDTPTSQASDGGKFDYLDNPAQAPPTLPRVTGTTPGGFPEPQVSDEFPAGAEKPPIQKAGEALQTVGAGMGLAEAPGSIYDIGKGIAALPAKLGGAVADAIPTTENLTPSIERIANNQTLKSLGGTMGQLGQMAKGRGGREALDAAASYARDNGLSDVFSTGIGREKALDALLEKSGKTVGALRNEAGPASPDIIKKIVSNPAIDKYLGSGSASKELGGVDTALNDIKEIGGPNPTHASLADAATTINKAAAGNKLYQPVNAETDVANILSRENDTDIAQKLGSEKAKQYVDALGDQSKLHPLEHLQNRGELREAGGRGGLGTRVIQEAADRGGYRMTAKAAAALHDMLKGENLAGNLKGAVTGVAKLTPAALSDAVSKYLMKQRGSLGD